MKIDSKPTLLDVVALLRDRPEENLARGQVGTIVDLPNSENAYVEYADDDGVPYAIIACPLADLILLHYAPQAALT